ncbi:MAG: twin-arginine translocation signal domain-containing protein, partial [Planctomycetota bacterium]
MYPPHQINRRNFLKAAAIATAASALDSTPASAQPEGLRPGRAGDVTVLNPQDRVPVSFIIDDSTCLVNMAHFGIPHFATAWPDRYKQDWRSLPREIPDSFVR